MDKSEHQAKSHKFRNTFWLVVILAALILWGPTIYTNLATRQLRYDISKTSIQNVPKRPVGIVFGAGIYTNGQPTPYLQWRIETAVKLYKAGRVDKLLMSGDNSTKQHDEPVVMANYAETLGVKKKDIVLDYAGLSTYDSCYRAKAIFNVTEATLITQGYHLPRAVLTCKSLGIDTIGVDAERKGRDWAATYTLREWVSTDKMVFQLLTKPKATILGKPEPI